MTKEEVRRIEDVIATEGFYYGFLEYTSFREIKDVEFHRLREDFNIAKAKLKKYLEEQGVDTEQ
jgi:hypothetical protein